MYNKNRFSLKLVIINERRENMSEEKKKKRDLQFISSLYIKPERKENGKFGDDNLFIVYRDNDHPDKPKRLHQYINPKMKFYLIKEEFLKDYKLSYTKMENVEEQSVPYKSLAKDMCDMVGESQFFFDKIKNRQFRQIDQIHQSGDFFSSDGHIEDHYKSKFLRKYKSSSSKVTKAYYDIEVYKDKKNIDFSGFPESAEAPLPVNLITLYNDSNNVSYTFILRDKDIPMIAKIEENSKKYQKKLNKEFDEKYGVIKYKFLFFDREEDLIISFFDHVNKLQPDFCSAFNQRFDMETMANRLAKKRYDMADIISHEDFPIKQYYFNIDTKHHKHSEKNDWVYASSYTTYIDLLIFYCTIRKGLGELESYSLDSVANHELGYNKIEHDYENPMDLAWKDFWKYIVYNVNDVLLLKKLEEKNGDIDLVYLIAEITETRISQALRKTVSLKNMAKKFYEDKGYVLGNNMNVVYGDWGSGNAGSEKFTGALVCDPILNERTGKMLNGTQSMFVFENVVDLDLEALYPSIIRAFNIEATTQHGRLVFEGRRATKDEDPAGDFIDDLETKNWSKIGHKWFNLSTTEQLLKKLEEMGI